MPSTYLGEEEMLAVLETLALSEDSMFVIDDRRRIVFWNHGMQRLLGFSHDEVAGRSCCTALAGTDAFGNRYCGDACPVISIAARGDSIRPYRLSYRAKSGTFVPLDVSILRFTLRNSKRILLAHLVRPTAEDPLPLAEPPVQLQQQAPLVAADAPERDRARLPIASRSHADARVRELTRREIEILGRLARAQSATTIAEELGISPLTARNHIQHVFEKLEVHSRSEAVAFAYRMHLV